MAKRKFRKGMVVWVSGIPDRRGAVKDRPRPLLITGLHPSVKAAPFVAYAISTRKELSARDPYYELPWDAETGGRTGLFDWSAVVLKWSILVEQRDVIDVSGSVSDEMLAEIQRKIVDAQWPVV